jgi:hypothetical protein
MEKFQDFFHAVYNTGVLDRKTKHLVALGHPWRPPAIPERITALQLQGRRGRPRRN